MNLCILQGKVITNLEYNFVIENKYLFSIATFWLEIANKSEIKIIGYNEMADFCYQQLKKRRMKNAIIVRKLFYPEKKRVPVLGHPLAFAMYMNWLEN